MSRPSSVGTSTTHPVSALIVNKIYVNNSMLLKSFLLGSLVPFFPVDTREFSTKQASYEFVSWQPRPQLSLASFDVMSAVKLAGRTHPGLAFATALSPKPSPVTCIAGIGLGTRLVSWYTRLIVLRACRGGHHFLTPWSRYWRRGSKILAVK